MKNYTVWRKYEFTAGDRWIESATRWQDIKHAHAEEQFLVMESRVKEDHKIHTGMRAWVTDTLRQLTGGRA